jgi:hypothetical protein
VSVSGNEILYTHQINRNIRKLLENDKKLNELFEKVNGSVAIHEYIEYYSYGIDDLIWFYDETTGKLKILRSLRRNNTNKPYFKDGTYEGSGWKDENEEEDLDSFGIDKMVERLVNNKVLSHESDTSFHKYGSLKNYEADVDAILMKNDLSNRNRGRSINFYPYRNYELESDNTIVNGYYRRYDNGLMEYDIIFRLGYRGVETIDGVDYDKIVCNDMDIDITEEDYNRDNDKYFGANSQDYHIFAYQNGDSSNYSMNDTMTERNRNDYVNVYGGTIYFPVEFRDTRYMVFTNGMMSYDRNTSQMTIEPCANTMTFIDKRVDRISPMLIAFSNGNYDSKGSNSKNGCLVSNRFHCKIIGFAHE